MPTILLLIVSNVFMTFAWYGHLRYKAAPLMMVIVVSWLIALGEYCFQVPANRLGYAQGFSGAELKTIQQVITLTIFIVFAVCYLKEPIRWNVWIGFAMICFGALCVFAPWRAATTPAASEPPGAHAQAASAHVKEEPGHGVDPGEVRFQK